MYRIRLKDDVQLIVAEFSPETLRHWEACLSEIAADPFPRTGQITERAIPIRGFPMRTYNYEITHERSLSGEIVFALLAEFFPEYAPLYVVNEEEREVEIFYLRRNDRS